MIPGVLSAENLPVVIDLMAVLTDTQNTAAKRTFNNVPIGNPSADRRVFVISSTQRTIVGGFCTVAINGQAASGLTWAQKTNVLDNHHQLADYSDNVTKATIEITPMQTSNGMIASVFSVSRRAGINQPPEFVDPRFLAQSFGPHSATKISKTFGGVTIGSQSRYNATAAGQMGCGLTEVMSDVYLASNGGLAQRVEVDHTFENDENNTSLMTHTGSNDTAGNWTHYVAEFWDS